MYIYIYMSVFLHAMIAMYVDIMQPSVAQGTIATRRAPQCACNLWSCSERHLSSSIFQVISIALMGCTATKAATAAVDPKHQMIDMDQSDLMDMDSSFDTWKFKNLPKGVSAPPSRRMHDRHLSKLDGFKETVEQNPLTFQIVVKIRRDLAEFEEAKDSSLSHTLIAQIWGTWVGVCATHPAGVVWVLCIEY